MKAPTIHMELIHCQGCQLSEELDGEMMCMNAIHWHGGTPENPECFVSKFITPSGAVNPASNFSMQRG